MSDPSFLRRPVAAPLVASLLLAGASASQAADSFDPTTYLLTIPSIIIGNVTYTNMVVKVGSIVQGPSGTVPAGNGDFYEPSSNQLTVADVTLTTNLNEYFNPVVTIASLQSIGGVAGAATYDGHTLTVPVGQLLGGGVYTGVQLTIGRLLGVASGMPTVSLNSYNPVTKVLTIPVIQYNGRIYTNVTATLGGLTAVQGAQLQDTVPYSFAGNGGVSNSTDGAYPYVTVVQASDGNFYGTTNIGGANGTGTVYRITSPGGAESVIYNFSADSGSGNADGAYPYATLVQGGSGDTYLYGTTTNGGASDQGTVFKVPLGAGTEQTLYSFSYGSAANANDGANPNGLVYNPADGYFYGTTNAGGAANFGTVFKISSTPGSYTLLHSFSGGASDGVYPFASLVYNPADGYLYGTTVQGGAYGTGTVFRISPGGAESLVWSFSGAGGLSGSVDGALPESSLTLGNDGYLYGTTHGGGANGVGTVFRISPAGAESVIYSFSGSGGIAGSADGAYPLYNLIQGSNGDLYGTTNNGGAYNEGIVFQMTTSGVETILHSFSGDGALAGSSDGAYPNSVIQGTDGNLYGTAYIGGAYNEGAVFRLAE